jgi:hypothetical protein
LVVPRAGWLEPAGDRWEPYRLCDPAGAVVVPVEAYLRDLQAADRPETTLRTYSIALLRWFRFLWAAGVAWDQATRAEARDFCRWIQMTAKPGAPPGGWGSRIRIRPGRRGSGRCPGRDAESGHGQSAAGPLVRAGHGRAQRERAARVL